MAKSKGTGLGGMDILGSSKGKSAVNNIISSTKSAPKKEEIERVKYGSLMKTKLKKKLKMASIEQDLKEYEIVEAALEAYLK